MPGVKDGGALQARCTKRILGYSLRELKVLYAINIEYKNIFFRKKKTCFKLHLFTSTNVFIS